MRRDRRPIRLECQQVSCEATVSSSCQEASCPAPPQRRSLLGTNLSIYTHFSLTVGMLAETVPTLLVYTIHALLEDATELLQFRKVTLSYTLGLGEGRVVERGVIGVFQAARRIFSVQGEEIGQVCPLNIIEYPWLNPNLDSLWVRLGNWRTNRSSSSPQAKPSQNSLEGNPCSFSWTHNLPTSFTWTHRWPDCNKCPRVHLFRNDGSTGPPEAMGSVQVFLPLLPVTVSQLLFFPMAKPNPGAGVVYL